jgi:hypothetical protein
MAASAAIVNGDAGAPCIASITRFTVRGVHPRTPYSDASRYRGEASASSPEMTLCCRYSAGPAFCSSPSGSLASAASSRTRRAQLSPAPAVVSNSLSSVTGVCTGASRSISSCDSSAARSILTASSRQSAPQRSRIVSPTGWNTPARVGVATAGRRACCQASSPVIGTSTWYDPSSPNRMTTSTPNRISPIVTGPDLTTSNRAASLSAGPATSRNVE